MCFIRHPSTTTSYTAHPPSTNTKNETLTTANATQESNDRTVGLAPQVTDLYVHIEPDQSILAPILAEFNQDWS